MDNIWSEGFISPGSTATDTKSLLGLEDRMEEHKKHLYPIQKTGSALQVYGENPRIVVNEIENTSAAIWYCLSDGTLLSLLKDGPRKQHIQLLLEKYFDPPTLPIIPVLRKTKEEEPKYKVRGDRTRVYSVFGGQNLRTFLGLDIHDPYRERDFPVTYKSIADSLRNKGVKIDDKIPESADFLQVCEYFLEAQKSAKDQLGQNFHDEETKGLVVKLELYSKLYATLGILYFLGIDHGHPHGGNVVVSWSKDPLSKDTFEEQLIISNGVRTNYSEMLKAYPNCYLHPLLIDFDAVKFRPNIFGDDFDERKILQLLLDKNKMHNLLGMALLPIEKWPISFTTSLFGSKKDLAEEAVQIVRESIYDEPTYDPRMIRDFFEPLQRIGYKDKFMRDFLALLLPDMSSSSENVNNWLMWINFFRANPGFTELRETFLSVALDKYGKGRSKDRFLASIQKLIEGKPVSVISRLVQPLNRKNNNGLIYSTFNT